MIRFLGTDEIARAVTVADGRSPTVCSLTDCQGIVIGEAPEGLKASILATFGVTVVGSGTAADPLYFEGVFQVPTSEIVVVVPDAAVALESLAGIRSSLGWVAPLQIEALTAEQIPALRRSWARLGAAGEPAHIVINAPDDELLGAALRAQAATSRAAIPAAQAATLMSGFIILAALGQAADHRPARRLLRRRGAGGATLGAFALADTLAPVIGGGAVGVGAGWLGLRLRANSLGAQVPALASGGMRSLATVLLALAGMWLLSAAVIGREPNVARRGFTAVDGVGLAAFVAILVALARGGTNAARLAAKGDSLLGYVPLLVVLVAAAATIRLAPLVVQLIARLLPSRTALARLSVAGLASRRTIPLACAGFVAAAATLGTFALSYGTIIERSAFDHAAFEVPLEAVISSGPALIRPSDVRSIAEWEALDDRFVASSVVRRGAGVRVQGIAADTIVVLGIDPGVLRHLHGWRDDYGAPRAALAEPLNAIPAATVPGAVIPGEPATLRIESGGELRKANVAVIIERRDGTWFERTADRQALDGGLIEVPLTQADGNGRVVGLRIGANQYLAERLEHNVGEGAATFEESTLVEVSLGSVRVFTAGGAQHTLSHDWSPLVGDFGDAQTTLIGDRFLIKADLQGASALIVPVGQTEPLPAWVDPVTASAALDGVITLEVAGGQLPVTIAGVLQRFPGVSGTRFAITAAGPLATELNLRQPGAGAANEQWLGTSDDQARDALADEVESRRFFEMDIEQRQVLIDAALTEPLSMQARHSFALAALITALLAIAALVITAFSDTVVDAPMFRSVAADGVRGAALRALVAARAWLVAVVALPLGLIGGILVTSVSDRIVAVTGSATAPQVPLFNDVAWRPVLIASAATLVLALVCCWLAARRVGRLAEADLLRGEP